MIVVSDATPLIFLGKLNVVELLKNLYQVVLVSPKVDHEAIINGLKYGHPDAVVLNLYYQKNILKIDTPVDQTAIIQLRTDEGIDAGEAETIVLAMQHRAALTFIDEQKARQAARKKSLAIKGTLGVLLEAFTKGFLDTMQTEMYIQQIIQRDDIWISRSLCVSVLDKLNQIKERNT
jgi:predicted nucleic acid-binding protein